MVQSLEESSEGLDFLCENGKKRSSITNLANHYLVEYYLLGFNVIVQIYMYIYI